MNNNQRSESMEQKIANVVECILVVVAITTLAALPVAFFGAIICSAF